MANIRVRLGVSCIRNFTDGGMRIIMGKKDITWRRQRVDQTQTLKYEHEDTICVIYHVFFTT